jgi:hypothetical protein
MGIRRQIVKQNDDLKAEKEDDFETTPDHRYVPNAYATNDCALLWNASPCCNRLATPAPLELMERFGLLTMYNANIQHWRNRSTGNAGPWTNGYKMPSKKTSLGTMDKRRETGLAPVWAAKALS